MQKLIGLLLTVGFAGHSAQSEIQSQIQIQSQSQIQIQSQTPGPFPKFTLQQGRVDRDGLPLSGASLCVLPAARPCFAMPPHTEDDGSKVTFDFGLDPRAERFPMTGGASVVFFSAEFSGGGSGTLDRLAMLRSNADGTLTNLLPYVAVTNVSDRALWRLPTISPYPVLVLADFIWNFEAGETHFSQHFFNVEVYRFDSATDRYLKALSYKTAKKYDGGDGGDRIRVLAPERPEILRRLGVR